MPVTRIVVSMLFLVSFVDSAFERLEENSKEEKEDRHGFGIYEALCISW